MTDRREDLARIAAALETAAAVLRRFRPDRVETRTKPGGSPVTEADLAVDTALRESLPRPGEGWLSEETPDDPARLDRERCWIVDPIDGTREFLAGRPEWCVSIGLSDRGAPVAGGIWLHDLGVRMIGAVESGLEVDGRPFRLEPAADLSGAVVLASRSEVARGEWKRHDAAAFHIRPTGSIAFKLAQVAAGRADATWTERSRHEWDVAGGIALVLAAGGRVEGRDGRVPRLNRPTPRIDGLLAAPPGRAERIREVLGWGYGYPDPTAP